MMKVLILASHFKILKNTGSQELFSNFFENCFQIEKVYSKIVPTWKDLFEKKKIWEPHLLHEDAPSRSYKNYCFLK